MSLKDIGPEKLYEFILSNLCQLRLNDLFLQNLQNYNYDMTAFSNVPTTLNTSREPNPLAGNIPYSGTIIGTMKLLL